MKKNVDKDLQFTFLNREKLFANQNLRLWYEFLYKEIIADSEKKVPLKILEIGSGSSPFKTYNEDIITTDILNLPFLDIIFDAHEIHEQEQIQNESLDMIILTNVMHHLKDPTEFLENAIVKLKANGRVIFTEPYFSVFSNIIYTYIHKEDVDKKIDEPKLANIEGPLSSANIFIPHKIFFERKDWLVKIEKNYSIDELKFFTSISYFATGGMTYHFKLPFFKFFFKLDNLIAKLFPKLFASFFICTLRKK
ncbi:MAG: methyltransferase domain-containing protein [Leptospiraceae bacterium]|nr:methyltransferase domain-containing protein [Leptospiraceae bacterium]